jgi:cysteinyl-tRNA synthetase
LKRFPFIEDDELASTKVDQGVVEALSDDLNTPLALARLTAITDPKTLTASGLLLGLFEHNNRHPHFYLNRDSGERDRVSQMVSARAEAKARRDFAEADRIRAELSSEGILLEDGPDGTIWRRG